MAKRTHKGEPTGPRQKRGSKIEGPRETPYVLRYPAGWRKVPKGELQRQAEVPAAAVRRPDGRGLVTLTIRGPLAFPLAKMLDDFIGVLEEKYAENDLEIVTSQLMETSAGTGMYTSWILRDRDRVYGHLTVQVGDHSYTLDGSLPVGAADAAREVGSIIGSFEVAQPGA